MVRDTTEGKPNFLNVRFGPMLKRWAMHTTKGREKYPDVAPGVPNWTLARGRDEYLRFKESAARHFEQWLAGDRDEDHAAAVLFNINGAEYVLEKDKSIDPSTGAAPPPEPTMRPKVHVYENGTALPCLRLYDAQPTSSVPLISHGLRLTADTFQVDDPVRVTWGAPGAGLSGNVTAITDVGNVYVLIHGETESRLFSPGELRHV